MTCRVLNRSLVFVFAALLVLLTPGVAQAGYASAVGPSYYGCRNTVQMSTLTTTTVVTVTTNCSTTKDIQTQISMRIGGSYVGDTIKQCFGYTKCTLSKTYSNPSGSQLFDALGFAQINWLCCPLGGVSVRLYG